MKAPKHSCRVRALRRRAEAGGPSHVSSVAGMEGHLIVAVASKLVVYVWTGEKLEGCAFFDAPLEVR